MKITSLLHLRRIVRNLLPASMPAGAETGGRRGYSLNSADRGTVLMLLAVGGAMLMGAAAARATALYWDDNGTTAGASGTPTGTWGTGNFWNTDSTGGSGGAFQTATTSADALTFVAGPGATSGNNAYTVSLNGDQSAGTLIFQGTGAITLGATVGAQTINLGTGGISVPNLAYTGVNNAANPVINANLNLQGDQAFSILRGTFTVNGVISGTGNLTVSGNGTPKTFNGANTYTGTTSINNTPLILGGTAGSLGTGDVILVGTFSGLLFNQSADITFANNISGAGTSSSVTKQGFATTLTLTGTNTYTNATLIRGNGAIRVASIATNLGAGAIKLGNTNEAGTLIYNGAGETTAKTFQLSGSTGGGTIQNSGTGALVVTNGITGVTSSGARTLTLRGANTDNNTIGAITNGTATTLAVTKNDAGKWILSGANSYNGATSVTAGTLLVNGDNSAATGAVSVASGATLGGGGTIGGATTAAAGSFLSAGSAGGAAGTLAFNGTLDVSGLAAGTGGLLFDLGTTAASDKIILSAGALSIGASALNFNDFSFTALGGFGAGTYTLVDTSTSIVGTLGASLTGTIGSYTGVLSLANAGQDIVLTVTAIPEPSTYATLLGGAMMLATVLRRRRG